MKRNVSLAEISDGRLYHRGDMVKADCHGCRGCSQCCRDMGTSIVLDPYDVYRFQQGLGKGLEELIAEGKAELNVVDGCVLPNLKMVGEEQCCAFLSREGRCEIHLSRPGICRLFPLGRYYENGDFCYFLQIGECKEENRTKVKVSKWIDTPDQARNYEFVRGWHYLLNELEEKTAGSDELGKRLNVGMLQIFYLRSYEPKQDFYEQFHSRLEEFRALLAT